MNTDQIAMFLQDEKQPRYDWLQLHAIIIDRGSKYSVTGGAVRSSSEVKTFLKRLKQDKAYRNASHNSYAARFVENGKIIDKKNDDGEDGAGMIILRELQKTNMVNVIVVVTRWFGGTLLFGDRFKHIQDSARQVIGEMM
jgi:putative IMPACT (imprinted ancient) family translation regulator